MRNRPVLVVALFLCVVGRGQEVRHAPTLEACAADMNLWRGEIPATSDINNSIRTGTKNLTVKGMQKRIEYIQDCASAYPQLLQSGDSSRVPLTVSLVIEYRTEITQRLTDFLERRDLWSKFLEEDDAGKR